VCFGTIDSREWHVDFTLVPKSMRAKAAKIFRSEVISLQPGYGNMALIYHYEMADIEVRKLLGRQRRFWIGDAVK
jgi:hypothetical protein